MDSIPALRNTVKLSAYDIEALPHHKVKSAKEWSSACPVCKGRDRFLFWPDKGNFWCRRCDLSGWIDQEAESALTADQIADMERAKRQARQVELDRKRTALEKLQIARPDIIYHKNLNGQGQYLRERWGLAEETIEQFKVGYCQACPTSPYSDSFTIPYYWADNLINIRHRLLQPNGQGKYRPEAAGLPAAIFNANQIKDEEWLVLVEGEFKAMVLYQNGLPAIGIPGANNFKEKWLKLFDRRQTIYVALDPGVEPAALKIARMFKGTGIKAKLVTLPCKPDDFFVLYGGNTNQFATYLDNGRVI